MQLNIVDLYFTVTYIFSCYPFSMHGFRKFDLKWQEQNFIFIAIYFSAVTDLEYQFYISHSMIEIFYNPSIQFLPLYKKQSQIVNE